MGKYAILLVLALNFAIIFYNYGLQNTLHVAEVQNTESFTIAQARNIAQGATQVAVRKLQIADDPSFAPTINSTKFYPSDGVSFLSWPDVQGEYRYEIENVNDNQILLTTIGRYNDREYQVNVAMAISGSTWNPVFPMAVFSEEGIEVQGSSRIVGFAGTNSTDYRAVDLYWSTMVDSALYIGPGGDPSYVVHERNFQSGNTGLGILNLMEPMSYPMPEYPSHPTTITNSSINITSWPPRPDVFLHEYNGYYLPEFSMVGNTTVNFHVGDEDRVLHVGHLNLQQGHFRIVGNGNLTIYVEDNITFNGSSSLRYAPNSSGNVTVFYKGNNTLDFAGNTFFDASVYAENADIRIGGSGGIQGHIITGGSSVEVFGNAEAITRVLFAPNAHVELTGSGRVRGPVVANTFKAVGNSRVFFASEEDINDLPELEVSTGGVTVLSWR